MNERVGAGLAASLVAAGLGWVATGSWSGLIAEPGRFMLPALVAGLLIALVGGAARRLRLRWYAVLGIQVVVLTVWLHFHQHPGPWYDGLVPTPHSIAVVIDKVRDGASAINTYTAPVPASYSDAPVYLLAAAVLVMLLVDLIACGLRQPPWAGLPVLVTLTIPISVLDGGLPVGIFVATGLLFALLLAVSEGQRALAWGRIPGEELDRGERAGRLGILSGRALGIGAVATVLALAVSLAAPVGDALLGDSGEGGGNGAGSGGTISLTNPLVDLRRDLVREDPVPLLDFTTDEANPAYLRLTVLDRFEDGAWIPSDRDLAGSNVADGTLPRPPGLRADVRGRTTNWQLTTTDEFRTEWLPTPANTRSIFINSGDWRYDPAVLDIASVADSTPTSIGYSLTAFTPSLSADALNGAPAAPEVLQTRMTARPQLPDVVTRTARDVTTAGRTDYEKAVLLQDWFRDKGEFTYSLDPAPGSGLAQLARFVTTDRVGYCEQFAAAMALMARSLDIPTRVVVGFLNAGLIGPDAYRYTSDDLHAWPEVYFEGSGWVRFEPTPSVRTGTAPAWTRGVDARPEVTPSAATPTPSQAAPTRTPEQTPEQAADATGSSSNTLQVVLLVGLALLVLCAVAAPGVIRVRQRTRRLAPGADPREDLEQLWAELRATAIDLGAPWPGDRSPRMVGDALVAWVRSTDGVTEVDHEALSVLVRLVERARYSPVFTPDAEDRWAAAEAVRRWSDKLRAAVTPGRARLAVVAPRSVLARRADDVRAPGADSLAGVR